ncbi:MAG: inositol monophosphatase family protein [Planctomyces sp.]
MSQQAWLNAAVEAAQVAGQVLLDWQGRFSVREKSRANLVTDADEASQTAIVSRLRQHFPDHSFLGEENLNERGSSHEAVWIIDPLDGTSNYVHGFPYYAVSIALMYQGEIEVGVILDPTRHDLFTAIRNGGAALNGSPLQTSGETRIDRAFGMASLPIAANPENPAVRRFLTALSTLQTVQRTGSAALNLANLAAGRIDAFWSSSLNVWDIAAGALLVTESGGVLSNLNGEKIDLFAHSLLAASSPELQQQLTNLFK